MSRASWADPLAGSVGADVVSGPAMAGSAAASFGWGVGVWLAALFACVGGASCVAPPPRSLLPPRRGGRLIGKAQICHHLVRCLPVAEPHPLLPPPLHVPHHLPLIHPLCVRHPHRWPRSCPSPPFLPLTPLRLPRPSPPPFYLLFFYPPLRRLFPPTPVACALRLPVAAFFFFAGPGGSGLTSSNLLELVVQLEPEEEEEGVVWRGRFFLHTRPSSSG